MNKALISKFENQYNLTSINPKDFALITHTELANKEKKQLAGKTQSVWKDVINRFFKSKWNIVFVLILITLIAMVIIVPLVSKYNAYDPVSNATTNTIRFLKPSWQGDWNHVTRTMDLQEFLQNYNNDNFGLFDQADVLSQERFENNGHILVRFTFINKFAPETFMGTDSIGRDVWTRLFVGASWSLRLAIFVATIETIVGTIIGIYVGFHVGSKADTFIMRIIEVFQSVPTLLWMFVLSILVGTSFFSIAFILIIVGWIGPVYAARMFTMKVKDAEFVKAAQSIGVSKKGILARHILPNIVGRLLVSFVHRIPAVIFIETTLVFLGMTVGSADNSSIGRLISEARSIEAINSNFMHALSIAIFLLLFTVSLQILANGVRDAFDPKTENA